MTDGGVSAGVKKNVLEGTMGGGRFHTKPRKHKSKEKSVEERYDDDHKRRQGK